MGIQVREIGDRFAWRILGLLSLGIICWLAPKIPALFDLIPEMQGEKLARATLASCMLFIALGWCFPRVNRQEVFSFLGISIFLFVSGPIQTLLTTLGVLLWIFYCSAIRAIKWRILGFIALAAAGYFFRVQGFYTFSFWWCYVHELKFLAIGLYGTKTKINPWLALSFFFSPPFLLGPLVAEWLTVDSYEQGMVFRSSKQNDKTGLFYILLGVLFLVGSSLALPLQQISSIHFLQKPVWNQVSGAGFQHLLAGAYIFLFMYWKRAGLTALAVGIFRLVGCKLTYDYDYFFLSKTHLEFCQRYHSNSKNFIVRFVYLPTMMVTARWFSWRLASFCGMVVALFFVAIVHFYAFIPLPGVPFQFHFRLFPVLNHRFWEWLFILATIFFFRISQYLAGKLPLREGSPLRGLVKRIVMLLQVSFAMTCVGYLFYDAYAQCWLGFTNWQFFRSITSW